MDCKKKNAQQEDNLSYPLIPLDSWLSNSRNPEIKIAKRGERYLLLEQLRKEVGNLAGLLLQRQEKRWALCFEDTSLFLVALLAVLHTRNQPIIPGNCLSGPLNDQQEHYDAVLTDMSLNLLKPQVKLPLSNNTLKTDVLLPLEQNASITLFTSGSTGQPKKIVKSLAAMNTEASWLASLLLKNTDFNQVQATVSHQHLYGLTFRLWLPLSLGISFDAKMKTYQEELAASINPATLLITSPAFIKRIDLNLDTCPCAGLVSAGGLLPWEDAERIRHWTGRAVTEIYGSTETGVLAWRHRKTENSYWTPFCGVYFKPPYANKPGRVFSPLIDDSEGYPVNDKLVFNESGQFLLLGRLDRTVKIEEKRISLDEVEQRLKKLPQVADAAVVVLEKHQRTRLGAVLVLTYEGVTQKSRLTTGRFTAQLREALHGWVEPVAIPKNWRIVEKLPLNSMGKLSQPLLKELFNHAANKD